MKTKFDNVDNALRFALDFLEDFAFGPECVDGSGNKEESFMYVCHYCGESAPDSKYDEDDEWIKDWHDEKCGLIRVIEEVKEARKILYEE